MDLIAFYCGTIIDNERTLVIRAILDRRRILYQILVLVTLVIPSQVDGQIKAQIDRSRKWPAFRSGSLYRKALVEPFSSNWKNRPLREILLKIADNKKVSIVLDRRIDPSGLLDISLDAPTLREGLSDLAGQTRAEASFADGFVYLGPKPSAVKLRTLNHLRVRELQAFRGSGSSEIKKSLLKRGRFEWKDLDSPVDILSLLSQKHATAIEGTEKIPHDLWFGTALPYSSFVDVLSLVLIQFDQTFRWSADFKSVEIIPVPEKVTVEKSYRPRRGFAEEYAKTLREKFPGSIVAIRGRTVSVKATLEIHDAIALSRSSRPTKIIPKITDLPLSKRSMSNVNFRAVPAKSLLAALIKQGILFEYDEKELLAAGVNLDIKITIKRETISGVELVKEICRQMGVDCEIFGRTVRLKLKK